MNKLLNEKNLIFLIFEKIACKFYTRKIVKFKFILIKLVL